MPFAGYDPANNPLNTNEWAFPVCEVIHILGFIILIGSIAIVDMRLLGIGMKRQSAAQLLKDTSLWTLIGLVLILISGPLIFSSDPNLYVHNEAFKFKITMLLIAIVYNWTIHRKVAASADPGGLGKVVAVASMAMWASLVFAGIFIAFV